MAVSPRTLLDFLPLWYDQLQQWSLSGRLSAAAREALLLDGEPQALQDLVSQWSAGNFQDVPEIVLLSNADINGALGAYAISTGKIYLNADWLETATQEAVNAVLTEELGHHLDGLLNTVDTVGDEGEYFSDLLISHGLSGVDKQRLRHQNDFGQITLNGTASYVEYSVSAYEQIIGPYGSILPGKLSFDPFEILKSDPLLPQGGVNYFLSQAYIDQFGSTYVLGTYEISAASNYPTFNPFIAKISSTGVVDYVDYEDPGFSVFAPTLLCPGPDGSLYIGATIDKSQGMPSPVPNGITYGGINVNSNRSGFVKKLTGDGSTSWTTLITGEDIYSYIQSILTDKDGNTYAYWGDYGWWSSKSLTKIDRDGNIVWTKTPIVSPGAYAPYAGLIAFDQNYNPLLYLESGLYRVDKQSGDVLSWAGTVVPLTPYNWNNLVIQSSDPADTIYSPRALGITPEGTLVTSNLSDKELGFNLGISLADSGMLPRSQIYKAEDAILSNTGDTFLLLKASYPSNSPWAYDREKVINRYIARFSVDGSQVYSYQIDPSVLAISSSLSSPAGGYAQQLFSLQDGSVVSALTVDNTYGMPQSASGPFVSFNGVSANTHRAGFVFKLDPTGKLAWTTVVTGEDIYSSIQTMLTDDSGNIYAIFGDASYYSQKHLCKLSSNGSLLWTANLFSSANGSIKGFTNDGNLIIVGNNDGMSQRHVWIASSSTGEILQSIQIPGGWANVLLDGIGCANGDIIVTGLFNEGYSSPYIARIDISASPNLYPDHPWLNPAPNTRIVWESSRYGGPREYSKVKFLNPDVLKAQSSQSYDIGNGRYGEYCDYFDVYGNIIIRENYAHEVGLSFLTPVSGSIFENTTIYENIKLASIQSSSQLLALNGPDSIYFEYYDSALWLKQGTSLDVETKKVYSVGFVDSSSNPEIVLGTLNFNVLDVNEAPKSIRLENQLSTIPESADSSQPLLIGIVEIEDDVLGKNSITLSGLDSGSFTLSGNYLYLNQGQLWNFPEKTFFNLHLTAFDPILTSEKPVSFDIVLTISPDNRDLTLYGDNGGGYVLNDNLRAYSGNDVIYGLNGDDTLYGGTGDDALYGGTGNDHLHGGGGGDNLYGQEGKDVLYGGEGDDYLDGGLANEKNILYGDSGDDTLVGYASDTLIGGVGSDTYYLNSSSVIIDDRGLASDVDTVFINYPTRSYVLPSNITIADVSSNPFVASLSGNASDNVLIGNDFGTKIFGYAGNDNLIGGIGNDNFDGGAGNDYLYAGDGNDIVFGGGGNDTIIGGDGRGDDFYDGGTGVDTVVYTSSQFSSVTVNLRNGSAVGTEIGGDTLMGIENVTAGQVNDTITGDVFDNRIDGRNGDDIVVFQGSSFEYQFSQTDIGELVVADSFALRDGRDTLVNIEFLAFVNAKLSVADVISAINKPLTDFNLTAIDIPENSLGGTLVGALSLPQAYGTSSFSYVLVSGDGINDSDNHLVEIVGSKVWLKPAASLDFETNAILNLRIQVTDSENPARTFIKDLTALVLNNQEVGFIGPILSSGGNSYQEGDSLSAGLLSDPDGIRSIPIYTWYRGSTAVQTSTSTSYTTFSNGEGAYRVEASYLDGTGSNVVAACEGQLVTKKDNGDAVFSISGIAALGNTLSTSLITDDPDGNGIGGLTYTWQTSSNGTNWTSVGTNSSSYTVAGGDEGKQLRVQVVYMDAQGFPEAVILASQLVTPPPLPSDTVPPSIVSISTQGTSVTLKFTEAVSAQSVPVNAFVVTTVSGSATPVTRTISTVSLDSNDPTRVILTLSGTAPASTVNLRVSYTDPVDNQTTGVVQDTSGNDLASFSNRFADTFITGSSTTLASQYQNLILTGTGNVNGTGNALNNTITGNNGHNTLSGGTGADNMTGGLGNDTYVVDDVGDVVTEDLNAGTDTVQSSVTYTLGANVENLTLTGTAAINGTGNALNNVLTGNSAVSNLSGGAGDDTLIGGGGADILTGLTGVDTFRFALADSRLAAFDRITDFAIGTDILDGPTAVTAANLIELGSASALTATAIGAVLTTTNFAKNAAATFSFGSGLAARTFLAINDGTAGFSSTSDGLIDITGYSGSLNNLAII